MKHNLDKTILGAGVLTFLYFSYLLYVAEYHVSESIGLGVVREVLTLPLLAVVLLSTGYSIYNLFRKHLTMLYAIVLVINLITITRLIVATIYS